jgi:spoIIIJ-associated protein
MVESIEISAKTVEEATGRALEKLNLTREEVEVTVITKGRGGILGLGAEDARIRVTPLVDEEDKSALAANEIVEKLLSLLKVSAQVQPTSPPEGVGPDVVSLNLSGTDLGVLIGRRGQTLAALQYIANLIMSHRLQSRQRLFLDVEGYRQRHYASLRTLALHMAEQVKSTGQSAVLEPMPANERRIVHLALAEIPDISTSSLGEGEARKVVILPKKR